MKNEEHLSRIDEYTFLLASTGFVRMEGILDDSEVSTIRTILKQKTPLIDTPPLALGPQFFDIMGAPAILRLAQRFLGEWIRLDNCFINGSFCPPKHDVGTFEEAHLGFQCEGKIFLGKLSVGIALDSQEGKDRTGLCYFPGSHHLPSHDTFDRIFADFTHPALVFPNISPGDAILIPSATWCRNSSTRNTNRAMVFYEFCPGFMTWSAGQDMAQYQNSARTETQRRLLTPGYVGDFTEQPAIGIPICREPTLGLPAPKTIPLSFSSKLKNRLKRVVGGE